MTKRTALHPFSTGQPGCRLRCDKNHKTSRLRLLLGRMLDDRVAVYLTVGYMTGGYMTGGYMTGGYTVFVPRSWTTPLDVSVEKAMCMA